MNTPPQLRNVYEHVDVLTCLHGAPGDLCSVREITEVVQAVVLFKIRYVGLLISLQFYLDQKYWRKLLYRRCVRKSVNRCPMTQVVDALQLYIHPT